MHILRIEKVLHGEAPAGEIPAVRSLFVETVQMAWPSVIESFLVALVGLVDMVMVGTLGSYAIAAVGLTTQPKFIGLAFFLSLNVAISAIVARRRGENDRENANRVLVQAVLIVLMATVVISTICVLFADPIIAFAGSAPDTHDDAVGYFRIIMGGMVFNTISLVINAAQRGAGNTRIAMRTNLVSNGVNIIFNYLLIGGNLGFPRLGVRGAAVATVIGTVCACAMSIRSVSHHDQFLYFHGLFHARFDRQTIKSIASIGSSTLAEQIFIRAGFLVYVIIVARLGTAAFAAHNIGIQILTLSFSVGDGLSVAGVALTGRSLGQGRRDLARIYGAVCQRIAVFFSCIVSVFFITLGRPLFRMFTSDQGVLVYSEILMIFCSIITFLQITAVVYSGCLRGAGDTVYTAFSSFISITIVRPLCGWVFCYPLGLGLTGAWLGLVCDQLVRFVLALIRFKSGKWTRIKI